jgi:hypothetical protein
MMAYLYNADMAKEKLTVYLSPETARALRVSAARRGIKDSDLVEEAVRERLGIGAMERSWARNADLTEEQAMELALEAQREVREERRRARQAAS